MPLPGEDVGTASERTELSALLADRRPDDELDELECMDDVERGVGRPAPEPDPRALGGQCRSLRVGTWSPFAAAAADGVAAMELGGAFTPPWCP